MTGIERWPSQWRQVMDELAGGTGTFAAVDTEASATAETLERLAEVLPEVVSVGQHLTAGDQPGDVDRLMGSLREPTLLLDLDVLFTPHLKLNVLTLLHRTAQWVPLVVAWPGRVGGSRLTYSAPGRTDHQEGAAQGVLILRPIAAHFPDEVPYVLERFLT